jgi:hypothetical protein
MTLIDPDVLSQFREAGHDDRACVVLLLDLIPGAGQRRSVGKHEIVIDGGEGRQAFIRFNSKGKIKEIIIPAFLAARLDDFLKYAACKSVNKFTLTTLIGYRSLSKYYRVDDWIQIRPTDTFVDDQIFPKMTFYPDIADDRPHPFVLEVMYKSTPELPMFEAHRNITALNEAKLLVSAFLELPVHQYVPAFAWALTPDFKSALVRCTMPNLENHPGNEFSDVSRLAALPTTDDATYFRRLGIGVAEFEVPDMASLRAKYEALSLDDKARFLRACANLWDSGDVASSDGKRLVSSISAIESLLPNGEKCPTCRAHIGISKRFKAFVRRFVPTSSQTVLKIYEALYASRSLIAHGSWHDMVDKPMFGLTKRDGFLERLAAWNAAKVGAIGWLNGGGNSTVWWEDCEKCGER